MPTETCTTADTVYDHMLSCLPNTGPGVPLWFIVAIGVAFLLMGAGTQLLTRPRDLDAEARALEARRRGHVL